MFRFQCLFRLLIQSPGNRARRGKGVARRIESFLRELHGSECAFGMLLLVPGRGARAMSGAAGRGIRSIGRAGRVNRRRRGPDVTSDTFRVATPTNTSSLKPGTVTYKH